MNPKAPKKKCPSCGNAVHVRKKTCECGYNFQFKSQKIEDNVFVDTDAVNAEVQADMVNS